MLGTDIKRCSFIIFSFHFEFSFFIFSSSLIFYHSRIPQCHMIATWATSNNHLEGFFMNRISSPLSQESFLGCYIIKHSITDNPVLLNRIITHYHETLNNCQYPLCVPPLLESSYSSKFYFLLKI